MTDSGQERFFECVPRPRCGRERQSRGTPVPSRTPFRVGGRTVLLEIENKAVASYRTPKAACGRRFFTVRWVTATIVTSEPDERN